MKRLRVVLADDHCIFVEALKKLIEPECEVVASVCDGRALLTVASDLTPDIIVLDIAMPLLNGLTAGERLKKFLPAVKLIYLTVNEDPDLAAEAFQIGASGYLLKNSAASELFTAIHEVSAGRSYLTPLLTRDLVESLLRNKSDRNKGYKLTVRQREVLQLLAEGHSMKEIGQLLKLSPRTVAFHKYRTMEQLGIKNSAELIQFAIKRGLISL
ncbi:MAG: response regulator transcription factor [Proteobacteria bacterium]|nr:response regulator transcription factor [Pseudomonadota bacterium]